MEEAEIRSKLIGFTSLASEYCMALENARETERQDFVQAMVNLLPRIYLTVSDISPEDLPAGAEFGYFPDYVDEDFYDSVRRNIEALIGEEDTFLETFEDDMKYSDTPIAASISECLADLFQPLYNFIHVAKDAGFEETASAFSECRDNFVAYWGQTLCNVMRPLHRIRYEG